VTDDTSRPLFQFNLRAIFVLVLLVAVWLLCLMYGPRGSAVVVGLFLCGMTSLIVGYQCPRTDARRGCMFAMSMLLLTLFCVSFVITLMSNYLLPSR
jgi:hypothetical protein